jgi:NADPH-dependent curcumin reductase
MDRLPRQCRQWVLARHPRGQVRDEDFALRTVPIEPLGEGEALARTMWLAFEPAMRGWLDDSRDRWGRTEGVGSPGYDVRVRPGDVVLGPAVASVVASRRSELHEGDVIRGLFGWRDHVRIGAGDPLVTLDPDVDIPLSLGVLGGNGLTAYAGLLRVGQAQPGNTVVVSGAAGSVGSVAGQIARIKGCRVIGIAGGPEKCAWLLDECGFNDCIDYRNTDVAVALRRLCPDSIDVYFDNVGGSILEVAIANMAVHGRIVLCGSVADYDAAATAAGPRNLFHVIARRVRMEGFLLVDHLDALGDARAELRQWVDSGRIAYRHDICEGFENVPSTFRRLFTGENRGKQLLRL